VCFLDFLCNHSTRPYAAWLHKKMDLLLAIHPDANQRPNQLPKESMYQYSVTILKLDGYNYQQPLRWTIYVQPLS
jgi:hypothetical protein